MSITATETLNLWGIGRWGAFIWGDNSDLFLTSGPDVMSWERNVGGVWEGDGSDNDAVGTLEYPAALGAEPTTITFSPSATVPYTLEVRDTNDDLVVDISSWWGGSLRIELDRASELVFSASIDNAAAADITIPNLIWLRDRWGFVVDTFLIRRVEKTRALEKTVIKVTCQSRLIQLTRERIESYDSTSTPVTVNTIISALFGAQLQTPGIGVGTIDSGIGGQTTVFAISDTTILAALEALQKQLSPTGHFYVDMKGNFNWRTAVGSSLGGTLQVGEVVQGDNYTIDYDDMITRLYAYGAGDDPSTRLTLEDAGEANEYIDSSNVATYGVLPSRYVDRNISYPAALLDAAQNMLANYDSPLVRLQITALDLAKSDGDRFATIDDLYVGSTYTVVDSDLSINESVQVLAMDLDLDHPLRTRLELSNRTRRIADLIDAVVSQKTFPSDFVYDPDTDAISFRDRENGTDTSILMADVSAGPTTPQVVNDVEAVGTSDLYSREDHAHLLYYTATTAAGLDNTDIDPMALGRVIDPTHADSDDGKLYKRNANNNGWELVGAGMINAITLAGLGTPANFTLGFVTEGSDLGLYVYYSGWYRLLHLYNSVSGSPTAGAIAFIQASGKGYQRGTSAWHGITHFTD